MREQYRERIDGLLDELIAVKGELEICRSANKPEVDAAELASEIAIRAAIEANERLIRMRKFAQACMETGYQPYPWEIIHMIDLPLVPGDVA